MPKESLSLRVPDLSAFARGVAREWAERHATRPEPPGHVETLNLLARALGHRNVQALRASLQPVAAAEPEFDDDTPVPLSDNARKALAQFDTQGRLIRWPHKFTVQRMAMWVLWTNFEAKRHYTEKEVNAVLKAANAFSDHVTLRRELVNHQLLARKSDCSDYWKLPARPDDETRALLTAWRARQRNPPPAKVRKARPAAPVAAGSQSAAAGP
jgi:hypothetical protein